MNSSLNYKEFKQFIKTLEKNNDISHIYTRNKVLLDIKNKRLNRCKCRKFDEKNLDINLQCRNPISSVTNMCYDCNKYNNYLGFVDEEPSTKIINIYETFARKNKIPFKENSILIGKYKPYIQHNYLQIKIIDFEEYTHIKVFLIPKDNNNNKGLLQDKYLNIVGEYSVWEDTYNCIPDDYKNDDNIVLDPYSHIPLLEYNLSKSSIYHDLTNKIYKKYTFNQGIQELILTQNIVELL